MSDLDRYAVRLRDDMAQVQWQDAGEIRALGARRARARRLAAVGTLTAAVLAATSVGVVLTRHGGGPTVPDGTSLASPPAASSAGASPAPPTGTGFTAHDMTFVTDDVGWLLTARPCTAGTCPVLVHTIDGGRTWTRLPALPADVGVDDAAVRFADTRTGYLYASDLLYLTRDGGATWHREPGYAAAVEVGNGLAVRVSPTAAGCRPACTYEISRASVGATAWQTVLTPPGDAGRVQLLRAGHRAFAAFYRNPAGGVSAHGVLLTSQNDGATWTTRADPCGTRRGAEAVGVQMAVSAGGSLTMLCSVRGGSATEETFVVTSADGGARFGPQRSTPGFPLSVGASSATTLFVAVADGPANRLFRSVDAGATWNAVATAPEPVASSATPPGVIGFQSGQVGRWLPGGATVFSTDDAGRTWTPSRLPTS